MIWHVVISILIESIIEKFVDGTRVDRINFLIIAFLLDGNLNQVSFRRDFAAFDIKCLISFKRLSEGLSHWVNYSLSAAVRRSLTLSISAINSLFSNIYKLVNFVSQS